MSCSFSLSKFRPAKRVFSIYSVGGKHSTQKLESLETTVTGMSEFIIFLKNYPPVFLVASDCHQQRRGKHEAHFSHFGSHTSKEEGTQNNCTPTVNPFHLLGLARSTIIVSGSHALVETQNDGGRTHHVCVARRRQGKMDCLFASAVGGYFWVWVALLEMVLQ
jgi:hypothetical protein